MGDSIEHLSFAMEEIGSLSTSLDTFLIQNNGIKLSLKKQSHDNAMSSFFLTSNASWENTIINSDDCHYFYC